MKKLSSSLSFYLSSNFLSSLSIFFSLYDLCLSISLNFYLPLHTYVHIFIFSFFSLTLNFFCIFTSVYFQTTRDQPKHSFFISTEEKRLNLLHINVPIILNFLSIRYSDPPPSFLFLRSCNTHQQFSLLCFLVMWGFSATYISFFRFSRCNKMQVLLLLFFRRKELHSCSSF